MKRVVRITSQGKVEDGRPADLAAHPTVADVDAISRGDALYLLN